MNEQHHHPLTREKLAEPIDGDYGGTSSGFNMPGGGENNSVFIDDSSPSVLMYRLNNNFPQHHTATLK